MHPLLRHSPTPSTSSVSHANSQEHFAIDDTTLLKFLERIECGYRDNPYHNRTHACDILQASLWILNSGDADGSGGGSAERPESALRSRAISAPVLPQEAAAAALASSLGQSRAGADGSDGGGVRSGHRQLRSLVGPADVLALVVAAIAHDVDHTGQNNAFHVSTSTELAIVYNDRSVLENHHAAQLFGLLGESSCDIFSTLSVTLRREVRDAMVAMILGTDMAVHFKNVDRLSAATSAGSFDLSNKEDRTFVLEVVLHSADIANPYVERRSRTQHAR